MDFLYPPPEERGRFVQLTSYDRDPVRAAWVPALPRDWSRKCVTLRSGQEHVAGEARGPGLLTRIFVAFPAWWNPSLYREIALRLWWDGEPEPSVEAPLGDFFGIHHAKYRQYDSRLFSIVSGGICSHAPMPFAKGFRLSFTQEGPAPVPLFFYGLGYYELPHAPKSPLRFHARWSRSALARRGEPHTFLDAAGRGYYVGLHLSTQNRDAWPLHSLLEWPLPRGFGLGHLEGWEELFVDGEKESRYRGTGHEEYFNTGWYFAGGARAALDWGCLHRSYWTGRTASYRYHWLDPIPFQESFRGILHHGVGDRIPADYSSVAYWYQEEPHARGQGLPPARERRVLPPLSSRRLRY